MGYKINGEKFVSIDDDGNETVVCLDHHSFNTTLCLTKDNNCVSLSIHCFEEIRDRLVETGIIHPYRAE
jgi:hypothetical protein